jgi:hypothetical protein
MLIVRALDLELQFMGIGGSSEDERGICCGGKGHLLTGWRGSPCLLRDIANACSVTGWCGR